MTSDFSQPTPKDYERMEKELREKMNGFSLDEVIVSSLGQITSVVATTKISSEGSPGYSVPVRFNSSEIEVSLEKPCEVVKKIRFPEILPLQVGDNIRVYIAAGTQRPNHWHEPGVAKTNKYDKRKLTAEEHAIKIEKYLGPQIVATYVSE